MAPSCWSHILCTISNVFKSVPQDSRVCKILHEPFSFLTLPYYKIQKAHVHRVQRNQLPNAKIHLALSDTVKESIKKNTCALHHRDVSTTLSEANPIPSKSNVSNLVSGFTYKVHDKYENIGISLRMFRPNNGRENIPKYRHDICTDIRIEIER